MIFHIACTHHVRASNNCYHRQTRKRSPVEFVV